MKPRALVLIAAAAAAVSMVLTTPLRTTLDATGMSGSGLSADSVTGTVWSGSLRRARIGTVPLGDVRLGIAPAGLLRGELGFAVSSSGPIRAGQVFVGLGDRSGVRRMQAAIPFRDLGIRGLPSGEFILKDVTVVFAGGKCVRATGALSTDGLESLGGPTLRGPLSCSGKHAVAQLSGDGATAEVRIDQESQFSLRMNVRSNSSDASSALSLGDFDQIGSINTLTVSGRIVAPAASL